LSCFEVRHTFQEYETVHIVSERCLQMSELGRVVYNSANVVRGGIVCFFPSYEYERLVYTHWEEAGFLQKIGIKKKVCIFV